MLISEYPPLRSKNLSVDPLCLGILPLVTERVCQITRTTQRIRVLLSQYKPLRTKHLPLDRLRLGELPLLRERRGKIASTPCVFGYKRIRLIRSASSFFPCSDSEVARLFAASCVL